MMSKRILSVVLFFVCQLTWSQDAVSLSESTKYEGLFDFFYDEKKDKVYLKVKTLEKEFLYVNALSQGIGSNDIGIDRGQLGNGVVVKFHKVGNKLLLLQPNQWFRGITDNMQEKNSIEEAFAKSVLFGFEIEQETGGSFLVDITDFLIRDAHGVSARLKQGKQGSYTLDKGRSGINLERTRAFPKNIEFDVLLTFTGEAVGREIKSVSPDASAVTVYQHHSFVELPDEGYVPRSYDVRSGGYPMTYLDYASPVNEPIEKRFIYRHRLEKKDKNAARSEAVEPIIYYLDPGTPEPVRSALLEGASWWNQAFEAAGYENAFQVAMLPEDADPMDLRYNVIQWVHRSTRGWSYGGSISDPRTGEIIKGHVSLGSLRIRQDFMIALALQSAYKSTEAKDDFAMQLALARIRQLSAHEVGHTLGFAHNFAASTTNRASVMDYPHPWIKLKDGSLDFSEAYAVGIGEWDKIIVKYAYEEFPVNEYQELQKLLDDAFLSGFRYISDADARAKGGSHAYAHLWDNGNDIVEELNSVMKVRKYAMDHFSLDNIRSKEPYSKLEDVFVPLYFYHRYQTEAVSKMIGGWDYSFSVKSGTSQEMRQVAPEKQREALEELMKTISVENLVIPESLLPLFPPRAISYGRSRESFKSNLGVNFDPFAAAATASSHTFRLLLHPERTSRLILGQSLDKDQLSFEELLDVLYENTFKKEHKNGYVTQIQNVINEQFLQDLFDLLSDEKVYFQVKAIGLGKLTEWSSMLTSGNKKDDAQGLEQYLKRQIDTFIKDPTSRTSSNILEIPDGSPIGMDSFE
ncbi:zinc-dependent metalloprotease [Lutimonas sp.]|uniref:zinc-dependent metalloprotease n=1 Tax=Lutimonas sp. TaxID=1872403 RepID=UPI003D9BCDC7